MSRRRRPSAASTRVVPCSAGILRCGSGAIARATAAQGVGGLLTSLARATDRKADGWEGGWGWSCTRSRSLTRRTLLSHPPWPRRTVMRCQAGPTSGTLAGGTDSGPVSSAFPKHRERAGSRGEDRGGVRERAGHRVGWSRWARTRSSVSQLSATRSPTSAFRAATPWVTALSHARYRLSGRASAASLESLAGVNSALAYA